MTATAMRFWEKYEPSTAAWREKRRLAAALRELAAVCVTTDAPDTALSEAADIAQHLAKRLGTHPRRTFKEGWSTCKTHDDFAVFIDRHPLTGESNPYAPPIRLHMEADMAVGLVTFGPTFE